jgi:hypothetical protein
MTDIDIAVSRLLQARLGHQRLAAPPLADATAAYAVQQQVARELGWFGNDTPRCWKSGGASRDAELCHAALPPAGVWISPARADGWPFRRGGIEAEVALRLRVPVDAARAAGLDLAGARSLIDAMCVSIEIVDSRWAAGPSTPALALAQLADVLSHGALVLGAWTAFDARRDWSAQSGRVRIGAQPERAFCGTHPLADPTFVLPAWLRHATREGATLPAGSVVTTGSWCGLLQPQAGDEVEVAFDGIGQASVRM